MEIPNYAVKYHKDWRMPPIVRVIQGDRILTILEVEYWEDGIIVRIPEEKADGKAIRAKLAEQLFPTKGESDGK